MTEDPSTTVGVIGAGTMGAGIAQVAAAAGWEVQLNDVDAAVVERAIDSIGSRFDRLVEKGRMTDDERTAAKQRLHAASSTDQFSGCSLVIEAIVEDLEVKTRVFRDLIPHLALDCIIASNTSSLSITKLADAIGEAHRTVGMHFFNPAPLMKLVEVIAGDNTNPAVVDRVGEIAETWDKVAARAADVPGFIVNHVARPYYLEAFRILEDGLATPDVIDSAMKDLAGFRMGPLELTDLIGQDVNTATTRSVWEQLDQPPLLAPSMLQEGLVAKGHLGRKTRRGVYDFSHDPVTAAIEIEQREPLLSNAAESMLQEFAARIILANRQEPTVNSALILARILCGLIVQAHHAHARGVASKEDIDTALKYGVNYPKGPFEWAEQIGDDALGRTLDVLNEMTGSDRFTLNASAVPSR